MNWAQARPWGHGHRGHLLQGHRLPRPELVLLRDFRDSRFQTIGIGLVDGVFSARGSEAARRGTPFATFDGGRRIVGRWRLVFESLGNRTGDAGGRAVRGAARGEDGPVRQRCLLSDPGGAAGAGRDAQDRAGGGLFRGGSATLRSTCPSDPGTIPKHLPCPGRPRQGALLRDSYVSVQRTRPHESYRRCRLGRFG